MLRQMADGAMVLAYGGPDGRYEHRLYHVLDALKHSGCVGVFLVRPESLPLWQELCRKHGQFLCIRDDADPQEISAALSAAEAIQPMVRNLRRELQAVQTNTFCGNGLGSDIAEEMRLAARLQRDFLTRDMPQVGPVRFDVLYIPASFVSGDIYDVTRLDETRVGFYVADAVGHGMPAALFTMFIKKAFETKRIFEKDYEIVQPHVSLAQLNADICRQELSSCEFCTATYCVLDTESLLLTYARAGHPQPILICADGTITALHAEGGLLGVFPAERYESRQVQLRRGDRLILYTDGAEPILLGEHTGEQDNLARAMARFSGMDRKTFIQALVDRIDFDDPAQHKDDITVLIADIEP